MPVTTSAPMIDFPTPTPEIGSRSGMFLDPYEMEPSTTQHSSESPTTEEPLEKLVFPSPLKNCSQDTLANISDSAANLTDSSLLNFNDTADITLASIASLLAVCGLLGNILALLYFWPKRKKAIPPFLYTIISAIDVLKSPLALPVLATLFRSRAPGLFENSLFCAMWPFLFYLLVRMSMFVTMLVSVTRTIVLVTPFHELSRRAVSSSVVAYAVLLTGVDIVFFSLGWLETGYRQYEGFCEIFPPTQSSHYASYSYSGTLQIELLLPVLLVIFSFIMGTISMVTKKTTMPNEDEKKLKRVSITIAIFTGVFLLCNIPGFLLQMIYLASQFCEGGSEKLSSNPFLKNYGHLLTHFFLIQLNAAVNPCIYVLRMPRYRRWTNKLMKDTASILKATVRDLKNSSTSSSSTEWG